MKNKVVLTFDLDGWRAFGKYDKLASDALLEDGVPKILEFLETHGLDATFFVVGQNAIDFPNLHRELAKYEIGNHTFSHPTYLNRLSSIEKASEIQKAHVAIEEVFGFPPRVFRAPHYQIDRETIALLKGMGYRADSSLLKVVFPVNYAWNYFRQKDLEKDPFELPLTSFFLPFNGTAAINYRFSLTRKIFEHLLRKKSVIVLNFHDKDFVNLPMKRLRLRNRKNSLSITQKFLQLIVESCEVLSMRQLQSR